MRRGKSQTELKTLNEDVGFNNNEISSTKNGIYFSFIFITIAALIDETCVHSRDNKVDESVDKTSSRFKGNLSWFC